MENINSSQNNLPASVQEMATIPIKGNVIPQIWFKTIRLLTGKPDLQSILILADVVFWHRPSELRCERSGAVIGHKKKFAADLLRRSYSDLESQFGISKKQCQESLRRLEELGVIKRVFRTVNTPAARLSNVMFLELKTDVLKKITFDSTTKPCMKTVSDPMEKILYSYGKDEAPLWRNSSTPMEKSIQTYGGIPPHHIEANTSSNISLSPEGSISEIPESSSTMDEREKENSISEKMLKIWNDLIPEKALKISSKELHRNLERALKEQLDGNLESWNEACENWKSSKFLMAEAEGISFVPSLSWFLDPKKSLVSRVFSREHYTFGDRAIAAKPIQDFEATEKEIASSNEVKIVKDIRMFVLQMDPRFYISYLKQSKFDVGGEGVQLRAGSSFAKEKINEAYFEKINMFLKEKYQMSLELQ